MNLEWLILSPEEVERQKERDLEWTQAEKEREAAVKACKAAAGDHDWLLTLEHPDDGSYAQLSCTRCPASMDDVYLDGHDMLYLYAGDVLVVDAGLSTLSYAAQVPVTVSVRTTHHSSPNGEEWDVEIAMEPTGAIERIEEEGL